MLHIWPKKMHLNTLVYRNWNIKVCGTDWTEIDHWKIKLSVKLDVMELCYKAFCSFCIRIKQENFRTFFFFRPYLNRKQNHALNADACIFTSTRQFVTYDDIIE